VNRHLLPQVVAHRGFSRLYPENTLLSMEQALRHGACYLECDIQLTKDKLPVLLHDSDLLRLTGTKSSIFELDYQQALKFPVTYPDKFGAQYAGQCIPLLSDFIELLQRWPDRKAFIEVKRASIRQFGREYTVQKILDVVECIKDKVIMISFDSETIQLIHDQASWHTGWVIDEWTSSNIEIAKELQPEFLFVDAECVPHDLDRLPEAAWIWALYEIDDPNIANDWITKGASFIETNDIAGILQSQYFKHCGCYGQARL